MNQVGIPSRLPQPAAMTLITSKYDRFIHSLSRSPIPLPRPGSHVQEPHSEMEKIQESW